MGFLIRHVLFLFLFSIIWKPATVFTITQISSPFQFKWIHFEPTSDAWFYNFIFTACYSSSLNLPCYHWQSEYPQMNFTDTWKLILRKVEEAIEFFKEHFQLRSQQSSELIYPGLSPTFWIISISIKEMGEDR